MSRAVLLRLCAEIESDASALGDRVRELRTVTGIGSSESDRARAALILHHAYGAVEAILARVARQIEGGAPTGGDWHKQLLDNASLDIPEVRPAVLTRASVRSLHELRTFRHFLRHAYAVELDAEELSKHRSTLLALEPTLTAEFDRLIEWIRTTAEALDGVR